MHGHMCYVFKYSFVTATNSKLILRENPYYLGEPAGGLAFAMP